MKILADASLPGLRAAFPAPFQLTHFQNEGEISKLLPGQDVLLCRSTLTVNAALLGSHHLTAVATASSGTDHIEEAYLAARDILCLDAKGANAASVADYVLACLAYLDKANMIAGKKVGIIGLGAVGSRVAHRLSANYQIYCFDPPKMMRDSSFTSIPMETLYDLDILCIHASLTDSTPFPSKHLINETFLKQLKPHCVLINAARGGIVDEAALLRLNKPLIYCTDVYQHEPNIDPAVIARATLCTPHIAGHSLEAKFAAIAHLSTQLHILAHLPVPTFDMPKPSKIKLSIEDPRLHLILGQKQGYSSSQSWTDLPWQELVLSLYNPALETASLKNASNKSAAFLELRKQHQQRHDFATYFTGV